MDRVAESDTTEQLNGTVTIYASVTPEMIIVHFPLPQKHVRTPPHPFGTWPGTRAMTHVTSGQDL